MDMVQGIEGRVFPEQKESEEKAEQPQIFKPCPQRREICIQVILYVIIWSNLLAIEFLKWYLKQSYVSVQHWWMLQRKLFLKREVWAEGLKNVLPFSSTWYGTGSPKYSKWCIRVPNTRKQNERTKIIIYGSPSSLYMSAWRKREILISRLARHFTWQRSARDGNKDSWEAQPSMNGILFWLGLLFLKWSRMDSNSFQDF